MKKYILSFLLLILFLTGCHHAPPPNNYGRPTRDYKMAVPSPVNYGTYHRHKPRDNNYRSYKSKPSYPNYKYPNHKKSPHSDYRYPNHKRPK